jgi:hypothetical protein
MCPRLHLRRLWNRFPICLTFDSGPVARSYRPPTTCRRFCLIRSARTSSELRKVSTLRRAFSRIALLSRSEPVSLLSLPFHLPRLYNSLLKGGLAALFGQRLKSPACAMRSARIERIGGGSALRINSTSLATRANVPNSLSSSGAFPWA